jgi:succinylglutamate desuccinylase
MREERSVAVQVLQDEMIIDRVMADLGDNLDGNTLILVGGIHGNEVMGLAAIQNVIAQIEEDDIKVNGRLIALTGNMEACRLGQRFLHKDLNRQWSRENIDSLHYGKLDFRHTEYHEMQVIYGFIQEAISACKNQLFLADLHTTSSETAPFLITHRDKDCLSFTEKFPLPVISGIGGFLDGTLFGYLSDLGHIGVAFEAGQHQSPHAMKVHESFIWLALHNAGICPDLNPSLIEFHRRSLAHLTVESGKQYKIISRYKINDGEKFKMSPGFSNFKSIKEGQTLANNGNGSIKSPYDGLIFMPLYQEKGDDGFFIIKEDLAQ